MNFGNDFIALLEAGLKEWHDGVDNFSDADTKLVLGHQTSIIGEKIYVINNHDYILVRDWILPVYDIESTRIGNCAKTRFRRLRKVDDINVFHITENTEPSNSVVKYIKGELLKISFLDNYRKTHPEKEACFLAIRPHSKPNQSKRDNKYYMIPFGDHEMVQEESLWNIRGYTGVSFVPKLKIQSHELQNYPRLELKSKTHYLW